MPRACGEAFQPRDDLALNDRPLPAGGLRSRTYIRQCFRGVSTILRLHTLIALQPAPRRSGAVKEALEDAIYTREKIRKHEAF